MSNWSGLPTEILTMVFSHLKNMKGFRERKMCFPECALTCRSWRITVHANMFFQVSLRSEKDAKSLLDIVSNNAMIRNWIRHMKYEFRYHTPSPVLGKYTSLLMIGTLCSYLETIEFNTTQDDEFYHAFYNMVTKRGMFKGIKKIPKPENENQEKMYLRCIKTLKESINHIYVQGDSVSKSVLYGGLVNKLQRFSKLKYVHGNVTKTNGVLFDIRRYVELLIKNDLITLKKLEIFLSSWETNNYKKTSTKKLVDSRRIIQPATSIETLGLFSTIDDDEGYPTPSDNFLIYIMKKFTCLNRLTLSNLNTSSNNYFTIGRLLKQQSSNVIFEFLQYLSKIPNCSLRNIIFPKEDAAELISLLYSHHNNSNVNKQPEMLHQLSIKCINLDKYNTYEYQDIYHYSNDGASEEIEEQWKHTTSLNYSIDIVKIVEKKTQAITLTYSKGVDALVNQQLQILEQAGKYFDNISVVVCERTSVAILLDYIANFCTQLSYLTIVGDSKCRNFFEDMEVLAKIPTLKELVISHYAPSLQHFQCISEIFPNLEHLSLEDHFGSFYPLQYGKSFPIHLPYTSLKYLKIGLKINCLQRRDIRGVYIKLTTDDQNQKTRYCLLKIENRQLNFSDDEQTILSDNVDNLDEPTEAAYKKGVKNGNILDCHIHCKSVEVFTVSYFDLTRGERNICVK